MRGVPCSFYLGSTYALTFTSGCISYATQYVYTTYIYIYISYTHTHIYIYIHTYILTYTWDVSSSREEFFQEFGLQEPERAHMDEERGWGWVFGGLGGAGSRKDIEMIFDDYTLVSIQKSY